MRKIKPEWDKIFCLALAGVMGSVAGYAGLNYIEDSMNGQDLSAPIVEKDNATYSFVNENTILKTSNGISYKFDFAARHIIINGKLGEEAFTGYSTFEGFGRPAEIEATRQAGCTIARAWAAKANAFDDGYFASPKKDQNIGKINADTTTYIKAYCHP